MLRILMVMHLPPRRELGGARIQLELGEHLRSKGHHVDLFTADDVFGDVSLGSSLRRRFPPRFPPRAHDALQALAKHYDVIDAREGNIPGGKNDLGFTGLLVARSVGLAPMYQAYLKTERRRFPLAYHGSGAGRIVRALRGAWDVRDALKSYASADLLNVPNNDERVWLEQHAAGQSRTVVVPYGLSEARRREFWASARAPNERLSSQEITFIGAWSLRKGAEDWPDIWMRIRDGQPTARLRLLGVGGHRRLPALRGSAVIEAYQSHELPSLLATGTVGAFPSYIEGFPFAVLEQLAAGIPVVAYDAPGARETLRQLDSSLLVPLGDTTQLASRVLEILSLDTREYARLSSQCRALAGRYTWSAIADQTVDIYRRALDSLTNS